MTVLRACATCGRPADDTGYCPDHERKPWHSSNRRARLGMTGNAWLQVRQRVFERDMGTCYLCGEDGANEVDHLVPVSEDGTSRMDNLASVHASCHERRHREPEWAEERVAQVITLLDRYGGGTGPRSGIGVWTRRVGRGAGAGGSDS